MVQEYGNIFGGRCLLPGVFCKAAEKELELLRHALYMSDLEFDIMERQHEDEVDEAYQDGRDDVSSDEDEAYSNGYAMGYESGYMEGYREGCEEAEEFDATETETE